MRTESEDRALQIIERRVKLDGYRFSGGVTLHSAGDDDDAICTHERADHPSAPRERSSDPSIAHLAGDHAQILVVAGAGVDLTGQCSLEPVRDTLMLAEPAPDQLSDKYLAGQRCGDREARHTNHRCRAVALPSTDHAQNHGMSRPHGDAVNENSAKLIDYLRGEIF